MEHHRSSFTVFVAGFKVKALFAAVFGSQFGEFSATNSEVAIPHGSYNRELEFGPEHIV